MELQPNTDDLEDIPESQSPEGMDLKAHSMELDDEPEVEEPSEMSLDVNSKSEGLMPPDEGLISEYCPGAGDLNTGNTGASDQNCGVSELVCSLFGTQKEFVKPDTGIGEGLQGETENQHLTTNASGKAVDQSPMGPPSTDTRRPLSEPSIQRQQGPRPTSDQRTTLNEKLHQQPLQQAEIFEAPTEPPSTSEVEAEATENGAVQHVADEAAAKAAPLIAFDSATDTQQEEGRDVGMRENNNDQAETGTDPERQLPMSLENFDSAVIEVKRLGIQKLVLYIFGVYLTVFVPEFFSFC
ncbi:unnamed protein product [Hydatigera taeniaeformis]|uniref:PRRT2 n=1 Tax=Hydatigena taeniaeformis TaxID=6205 RepID=A0A0R3WUG7_HYDTA|nr:unnamed protein product [Hydatigera taeniaeformis]